MINLSLNKKIYLCLAGLFIIGLLVVFIPFLKRLSFPNEARIFNNNTKATLGPNEPITQIFTATENDLSQVKILMGNVDLHFGEKLEISIKDADCDKTVRTASHSWPYHSPKQYDFFTFKPIPDSKGQSYCFSILWKAEKRDDKPYVYVMKETGNSADHFTVHAKATKEYPERTMIFHAGYKESSFSGAISELGRRISAYKADFLNSTNVILIISFFIMLTIILVIIVIVL